MTPLQLDGHACARCGREYGPGSTSAPDGYSTDGRQLFRCSAGRGCSSDPTEESLRLMHYRAEPLVFDPSCIYVQSKPSLFAKPAGLWVSVEGEQDWPAWCRDAGFAVDALALAYEVKLRESAHLRRISSAEAMDQFHEEFAVPTDLDPRHEPGLYESGIDWSAVAQRYDGLVIAPYIWSRRLGAPCSWYYVWDCASGCIWNLSAIKSVTATNVKSNIGGPTS